MKLQLTRPLAAFDTETTGPAPQNDRIVELGIVTLYPDGTSKEKRYLINPGCPIPAGATAVHGITDADVQDCPLFEEVAKDIASELADCDFLTANGNSFDIPLLAAEFERAKVGFNFADKYFLDALNLFKQLNPRTLSAAYKRYIGTELEGAHGAIADTNATIEVFKAMLNEHEDLPADMETLASKSNFDKKRCDLAGKFNYNSMGVIVFTFGTYKDQPAFKEQKYLDWMLNKKDADGTYSFSHDTRQFIGLIKKGKSTDADFKEHEHKAQFRRF